MRWLITAIAASSVKSNRSHALNLGLSLFSLSGCRGFGSAVQRLRPSHHDWNDVLQGRCCPPVPFPLLILPILAQVLNLT